MIKAFTLEDNRFVFSETSTPELEKAVWID